MTAARRGATGGAVRWEVLASVDQVDAVEWDAVVAAGGGTAFHTHTWLRAYEQAPPEPLHHVRHVTMRRGGRLRLVAPMYDISQDPHFTGYGSEYEIDHALLGSRMLVAHSWYSYYNGICTLDDPTDIAGPLCGLMGEVATEIGAPLHGFPGVAHDNPLSLHLAAQGFHRAETEATSRADTADTFPFYLARLQAKTRREFGRLARRHVALGAVLRSDVQEGDPEAFARLVADVCIRHGSVPVNPPENLLHMFEVLRDQLTFLSMWKDGRMLGGFVLLRHRDVLYAWIAGLDYEYLREYATYYALNWETLRLAHEWGVRRVEMGRGMYGFKVRLGLDPVLLVTWLRATRPEDRQLLDVGMPAVQAGCRTREHVREAYRRARRVLPRPWDAGAGSCADIVSAVEPAGAV